MGIAAAPVHYFGGVYMGSDELVGLRDELVRINVLPKISAVSQREFTPSVGIIPALVAHVPHAVAPIRVLE
jgi:hypothetical protein